MKKKIIIGIALIIVSLCFVACSSSENKYINSNPIPATQEDIVGMWEIDSKLHGNYEGVFNYTFTNDHSYTLEMSDETSISNVHRIKGVYTINDKTGVVSFTDYTAEQSTLTFEMWEEYLVDVTDQNKPIAYKNVNSFYYPENVSITEQ